MSDLLEDFEDSVVSLITNDGRNIVGLCKGSDQYTNIILERCYERVFTKEQGVEIVELGLYVVRGDNIAIIGEVDVESDQATNWAAIRADPIPPLVH